MTGWWARIHAKLPRTFWGFPVEEALGDADADGQQMAPAAKEGQRGIALIIAIMIISVMMLFTSDLILSSQVNLSLATHAKDNLKAEYMAKSGMNIATLMVLSDFAYTLFMASQNPTATTLSNGEIWKGLNGLPIGGENAEMLGAFQTQFGISSVMDSSVVDQLKLFDGSFTINVSDESSKININDCYQNGRCAQVMLMLEALFSCPAEKSFLESKRLVGKEMAYRIKNYIDQGANADEASGFTDKNEPYQRRTPRQMAKKAPLDSLSELRMVEGWDADMQAVFAPYLTAFPYGKVTTDQMYHINLNTASRGLLQCIFPESRGDCAEKVAVALKKRDEDGASLGQPGDNTATILRNLLCYSGGDAAARDASNRAEWFSQFSTTFRIEVEGVTGGSVKKLDTVVELFMPDLKKKDKTAYRILYWKVM